MCNDICHKNIVVPLNCVVYVTGNLFTLILTLLYVVLEVAKQVNELNQFVAFVYEIMLLILINFTVKPTTRVKFATGSFVKYINFL